MKSDRENAIYLHLYHGRKDFNASPEDWGTIGPIFKLNGFYMTYGWKLKLDVDDNQKEMIDFELKDGMVLYDGIWYGDFNVFAELDEGTEITELDVTKMNK